MTLTDVNNGNQGFCAIEIAKNDAGYPLFCVETQL